MPVKKATDDELDTEGQRLRRGETDEPVTDEQDAEGHGRGRSATEEGGQAPDDDAEGHGRRSATDDDDTEGHRAKRM